MGGTKKKPVDKYRYINEKIRELVNRNFQGKYSRVAHVTDITQPQMMNFIKDNFLISTAAIAEIKRIIPDLDLNSLFAEEQELKFLSEDTEH